MTSELLLKLATALCGVGAGVLGLVGKLTDERKRGFFRRLRLRGWFALAFTAGALVGVAIQLRLDEYSGSARADVTTANHQQTIGEIGRARLDLRNSALRIEHLLKDIERSLAPSPSPSASVSPTPKS